MVVRGRLVDGVKHFQARIGTYPTAFKFTLGFAPYPGTLNVDIGSPLKIREERRLLGAAIGEPHQDLLFEACTVAGQQCFRVRPLDLRSGAGGHGDHIIEVVSAVRLRDLLQGTENDIAIEFSRRD